MMYKEMTKREFSAVWREVRTTNNLAYASFQRHYFAGEHSDGAVWARHMVWAARRRKAGELSLHAEILSRGAKFR